jgi:hypothetical protein
MKYIYVLIAAALMMTACGKSAEEQAIENSQKALTQNMDKQLIKMREAKEFRQKSIETIKAQRAAQKNKGH